MPPIPSGLDDGTIQLIESTTRRQNDLTSFQIPRLKACNGPLSLFQQLSAELREDIEIFARQVEALDVLVGDQRSPTVRKQLQEVTDEFQQALVMIRKDARTALLGSKRIIDLQSNSNREELLGSAVVSEKGGKDDNGGDKLMKANNDVTDALRRTINLMQGELEKSVLSSQMLESSTATLRSTSTQYDAVSNLMGTSKQLITALEKSDWLDRILIISGLFFFFCVVLFILKERIVDRGLRIAFWWTRFLPDFSGDVELLKSQEEGSISGSSTVEIVSSILSTSVSASLTVAASRVAPALTFSSTGTDVETSSVPSTEAVASDPSVIHVEL